MPKMTKTQQKRAYRAIKSKAQKLWAAEIGGPLISSMSTKDYMAIERICDKYLKRF
jgi:hypothetical protein